MADLPPLPEGFTLDQPQNSQLPPLPPGFTLDQAASPVRFGSGRSFDNTTNGLVPSNSQAARDAIAPDGGPLRQVALQGRAAAEGVIGTLAVPLDQSPAGMIRNALTQRIGLPDMSIMGLLNRGLNAAGAYNPETSGEQMGSAVTRGVTGALTGAGLSGSLSAANAVRAGISGATGAGASELARQKGYGPGVQIIAGLAGGLAPTAIEETARLAGRTAANLAAPFTRAGQERIAGRVMTEQASDPATAVANLQAAQEIVPGSARNTGEASQDVGLLALEKGLRSRNSAEFGQRISEQNAARQNALAQLAGSPEDIQALQDARNLETTAMREGSFAEAQRARELQATIVDRFRSKAAALQDKGKFDTYLSQSQSRASEPYLAVPGMPRVSGRFSPNAGRAEEAASASTDMGPIISQRQAEMRSAQNELAQLNSNGSASVEPVLSKIDSILASPIGKRDIPSSALQWVRGKLEGETDPARLYAVRQDIADALAGKLGGDAAKFRLARKELMDVRSSLDNAIEQSAPGFKAYLRRYSELSEPIDQLKVMQEIQQRAQLTAADVTTGQQILGSANFTRALDSALQKAGNRLTPDQIEQLNAIKTDLQYGQAINSPLVKAPGSDTYQNLSIAQAISAGGKLSGPLKVILKPIEWLHKMAGTDSGVNEALTRAMLDPKLAALMLQRATPQRMAQFSERLKAAGIGATAGTLATQSAPSAAQNSSPRSQ
jgi:hypothetical protein